jgi:hypothetical protein
VASMLTIQKTEEPKLLPEMELWSAIPKEFTICVALTHITSLTGKEIIVTHDLV